MLNAQIPRTLQVRRFPLNPYIETWSRIMSLTFLNVTVLIPRKYGNPECSCWVSGCGEFDIAEALHSGSTYLKSTIHANQAAGDSDYFERPTTSTMKLAVVFDSANSTVHLQVLPNSTEFSAQLTADEIHQMCTSSPKNAVSHFNVSWIRYGRQVSLDDMRTCVAIGSILDRGVRIWQREMRVSLLIELFHGSCRFERPKCTIVEMNVRPLASRVVQPMGIRNISKTGSLPTAKAKYWVDLL